MQLSFLRQLRASHLSLTLVGLMWLVPFLHYRHENPLTTFYQEGWSFALGLAATLLLLGRDLARSIPRIVLLPLGLIVIVLVQLASGKIAYFAQAKLFILYLLFAALLMLLGAALRRSLSLASVALVLSAFLLVGAELNALIGVLQHFHLHTPFDAVIVGKFSSSLSGNLAQPNHYANYLALGVVSLGLLYQQAKLHLAAVVPLLLPLLFVLTLSGSRSSWLYLLLMAGLSAWWAWRNPELLKMKWFFSAALAMFAVMHLLVQLPFIAHAGDSLNTLDRMFGSDANGSVRWYLWREAALVFSQYPWLGVGFGQFALQHFELQPLQAHSLPGLYTHAHNLVLQLAAETGVAGLSVLLITLTAGVRAAYRARQLSAAHCWAYAALGVLAIHSLLEYPLWYVYFLAIAAVLFGMLEERYFAVQSLRLLRATLVTVWVLGGLSLWQFVRDYQQLQTAIIQVNRDSHHSQAAQDYRARLLALDGNSLLHGYAMFYLNPLIVLDAENLPAKLAQTAEVMRFLPTADVAYREAFLLAKDNQVPAAQQRLTQAIWSYPHHPPALQLLQTLAENDPAHFVALLEFATQKQQEYDLAVRP